MFTKHVQQKRVDCRYPGLANLLLPKTDCHRVTFVILTVELKGASNYCKCCWHYIF